MIELPNDVLRIITGYITTKCIVCNKKMLFNKFNHKMCSNYCWCIFWIRSFEIILLPFLMCFVCPLIIFYYYIISRIVGNYKIKLI
mgnify:CR=1 FL=1